MAALLAILKRSKQPLSPPTDEWVRKMWHAQIRNINQQERNNVLSKEIQNTNLRRYMHPYVHHSIIYNSQNMEATEVS